MKNKNISPLAKKLLPKLLLTLASAGVLAVAGCGKSSDSAAPTAAATPEPFTGQVYEIKMRGTAKGYSFDPVETSIKRGDKVRFTMVDGGPHDVSFADQKLPPGAAVIMEREGKLVGASLQAPGQTTEIIFGKNLPPGDYNFVCTPHAALGMKGKISVSY